MNLQLNAPALFADYRSGEMFRKIWSSNVVCNASFRFLSRKNPDGTWKAVVIEQVGLVGKEAFFKSGIESDAEVIRLAEWFMAEMKEGRPGLVFMQGDFSDCDTLEKFLKRWDEYELLSIG